MRPIKLIWEPEVRILTGNGPQAVDEQTALLRTEMRKLESA